MTSPGKSETHPLGTAEPCALCGARSGVGPDHDGWVCLVCGAPRILVNASVERPRGETALLERAKRSRLGRTAWGVAASLSLAFTGAVLAIGAVTALMFDYGATAQAVYGTLVITSAFLSALGFYRARRAGHDARSALYAAQTLVAGELIAAHGGTLEAERLANLLKVPVARAEELIAAAQVDRMLTDGDRFRVEEPAAASAELESPEAAAARRQGRN